MVLRSRAGQFLPKEIVGHLPMFDEPQRSAPRLGSDVNFPIVQSFALDSAESSKRVAISGNFLWAITATDINVAVDLRFNSQRAGAIPIGSGFFLSGIAFDEIYLDWLAQAAKSITFVFGLIPGIDFVVINPNSQSSSVTIAGGNLNKPATVLTTADVSLLATATTQIRPINTVRHEIIISNLAGNTQTFRIGESAAAAARGIPLAPGQTIILTTTAAIPGHNPGAGAESVSVLEISD